MKRLHKLRLLERFPHNDWLVDSALDLLLESRLWLGGIDWNSDWLFDLPMSWFSLLLLRCLNRLQYWCSCYLLPERLRPFIWLFESFSVVVFWLLWWLQLKWAILKPSQIWWDHFEPLPLVNLGRLYWVLISTDIASWSSDDIPAICVNLGCCALDQLIDWLGGLVMILGLNRRPLHRVTLV